MSEDNRPINLTVQLPAGSSMFPSWITVIFIGAFVLASIALLLVWEENRELVQTIHDSNKEFTREIRILQIHAQDIENVMIRRGVSTRQDFVNWESITTPKPAQSATSP